MPVSYPGAVLPDYNGAGLNRLVAGLFESMVGRGPHWVPAPVHGAAQVVLVVLDGLGWEQLHQFSDLAPHLVGMEGGHITSVAPTTTATALTSITTGLTPAEHGIVGYRLMLANGTVMNTLGWCEGNEKKADLRQQVQPEQFQPHVPFAAAKSSGITSGPVPVVSRAGLAGTGFSSAHLRGTKFCGWRVTSSLVVETARLLEQGEPFVYVYYDGIDNVAHEWGMGRHYQAELASVDRLVADLVDAVPPGVTVVVTADHGQVDVGGNVAVLPDSIMRLVVRQSGEARFRWLHTVPGRAEEVKVQLAEALGDLAWVRTRQELQADNCFGVALSDQIAGRLGDVAVLARGAVAFYDPLDTGEKSLVSRHGSLTPAEMWVPLLAQRA